MNSRRTMGELWVSFVSYLEKINCDISEAKCNGVHPCRAEFISGKTKFIHIFHRFLELGCWGWFKYFLVKGKDPFSLHNQYHSCWWCGNARSHSIGSHGMDIIWPEYSGFSFKKVYVVRDELSQRYRWPVPFITLLVHTETARVAEILHLVTLVDIYPR